MYPYAHTYIHTHIFTSPAGAVGFTDSNYIDRPPTDEYSRYDINNVIVTSQALSFP